MTEKQSPYAFRISPYALRKPRPSRRRFTLCSVPMLSGNLARPFSEAMISYLGQEQPGRIALGVFKLQQKQLPEERFPAFLYMIPCDLHSFMAFESKKTKVL